MYNCIYKGDSNNQKSVLCYRQLLNEGGRGREKTHACHYQYQIHRELEAKSLRARIEGRVAQLDERTCVFYVYSTCACLVCVRERFICYASLRALKIRESVDFPGRWQRISRAHLFTLRTIDF